MNFDMKSIGQIIGQISLEMVYIGQIIGQIDEHPVVLLASLVHLIPKASPENEAAHTVRHKHIAMEPRWTASLIYYYSCEHLQSHPIGQYLLAIQ